MPFGDSLCSFGKPFGKRLGQRLGTVALPVILSFDLHVKPFGSDICRYQISVITSW